VRNGATVLSVQEKLVQENKS